MSVITDILSAPIQGILDGAADVIKTFVKDPNAQLQAQLQLAQMSNAANGALLQADQEFANAQAQVITAEEKEGWLAANWRPLVMLLFGFIVLNNYVLNPWFHTGALELPPDLWALLKIGMGGYIMGRSVEKFLPATAGAIANAVTANNTPDPAPPPPPPPPRPLPTYRPAGTADAPLSH